MNPILSDLQVLRDLREGLTESLIDADPDAYILMFKYEGNSDLQILASKMYFIEWVTNRIDDLKGMNIDINAANILTWLISMVSCLNDFPVTLQDAAILQMVSNQQMFYNEILNIALSGRRTLKEVEYMLIKQNRLFQRHMKDLETQI